MTRRPRPFAEASAIVLVCAIGCGKARAPVAAAPTGDDPTPTTVATGVLEAAAAQEPPFDLPAGQTLGDLLPPLPVPVQALGTAASTTEQGPDQDCAELGPDGFVLVKRLEVVLPPSQPGALSGVVAGCLFQQSLDRGPGRGGKAFHVLAAWPGKDVTPLGVAEITREPATLPPERKQAGHDAASWASLIATPNPQMPLLAVVSARFTDGALGEDLHWRRQAYGLDAAGAQKAWRKLGELDFRTVDLAHLGALCNGKANASPADVAAGALQLACDKLQELESSTIEGAQQRQDARKKRLQGAMPAGALPVDDPDPQAAWLAQAKGLLKKGAAGDALALLAKIDMACGEPVEAAHVAMREAVGQQVPARVRPNQSLAELCEPLPDKPAPKRSAAPKP